MNLTVIAHPSPNFGPRKDGGKPRYIVVHYTAMADAKSALARLCDPVAEVSAHYLISKKGDCFQLVDDEMRAWHAGAGSWGNITDMNSNSIGIELDNMGDDPFSEPLLQNLECLLRMLMTRWDIPAQNVIAHSDLAPGRKIDPGPHFDWARLARQNLAATVTQAKATDPFDTCLAKIGYDISNRDAALAAFRLRHRPTAAGPQDAIDHEIAAGMACHFPVDRAPKSA